MYSNKITNYFIIKLLKISVILIQLPPKFMSFSNPLRPHKPQNG